jgi:hypothetical protein
VIFLDTAAFLAIENRKDSHHFEAIRYRDACFSKGETLITSDYILDESYTIIRMRAGHSVAVGFGETVRNSSILRIEYMLPEIIEEAWLIFQKYSDHDFSFTDCTSFRLMERLHIKTVFTFDSHFREYGRFIVKP